MKELTKDETDLAVKILKKIAPGDLPREIFFQIARIYVSSILEVVPFVRDENEIKVLLLERDLEDPVWGGRLHTPGTVLRATDSDTNFCEAFERIINGELKNLPVKNSPVFVDFLFHKVARGKELALIHWVELKNTNFEKVGNLFNIENLPKNIIDTQVGFIELASEDFKKYINKEQ